MPSRQAASTATNTHRKKPHAPADVSKSRAKASSTKGRAFESARTSTRSSTPPAHEGYERDPNYGLVSVLYHALKAADITTKYLEDARHTHDEELVEFFEEARAEQMHRAAAAEVLLGSRLESAILEDDVDDVDEELEADEDAL